MFDEVTCLFLTLVLSKQNIYHSMTTHKPMLHPATTTDVLMLTSKDYKIFSNVLHKLDNIIRKQMKKLVDFIIATSFKVIIQRFKH